MAYKWEKNIFGMVAPSEWLNVGFQVTRQNDPIDGLFGDLKTNNIMAEWQSIAAEYQIPIMAQYHGFDTEANTTFRVPVDTHSIEKGLIKVKLNQSERLSVLKRSGVENDEMYDYVLNDGIRLADQVFTRSKVAKNEVMASGKMTIRENGLNLTIDYGVPAANTAYTLDFSTSADIPAQIQAIIDDALDKGVTINGLMTSRKNLTKMRQNQAIQQAINGTIGTGALVKMSDLEAYLETEFGIAQIVTNDLTYGSSGKLGTNGRPVIKTARYYPDDKITFFAANSGGRLGVGLWGDPPEVEASRFMQVGQSEVSPYVYISQWAETDPAVLWTKASGLFVPVLYNPDSLFIGTIQ